MIKKVKELGFTIVELVIVIAVIAILAAILIPTFTSVVNKANNSAIQSELKSAYTQYVTEASDDDGYQEGYLNLVFKYIDSKSVETYYNYSGSVFSLINANGLTLTIIEYSNSTGVAQDAIFGNVTLYLNN